MRTLHHVWFSAACRMLRLGLAEKGLAFTANVERIWEGRDEFLALNPAGEVPVLIEPDGTTLTEAWVITEYLEEVYPETGLLGADPVSRAETRRLLVWFAGRFAVEVTDKLAGQKIVSRFIRDLHPSAGAIRSGREAIGYHLDYIGYLAEQRHWLAGDTLSWADLAAGAELSLIDYAGEVPWDAHPEARAWYARLKSRPSFRPLLEEEIPGVRPAPHYADPDF